VPFESDPIDSIDSLQVLRVKPIVCTHKEYPSGPRSYWTWQTGAFCEYAIYSSPRICIIGRDWHCCAWYGDRKYTDGSL